MNFLTANVAVVVDASKVPAQLAKIKSATIRTVTKMEGAFRRMGRASDRVFAKIARGAKLAAVALIAAGIASVKMAANVEDSEDFFVMAMGNMADSTRKWSEELAESLELNQFEVRETVAVFNEMTTAMGLNAEAAAEMSQRYTQLAYDLVSFHPKVRNLQEASIVLQAGLTGEREALKRLGYYYSEAEVSLEAVRLGYGKNTTALTALQKLKINDILLTRKMANVQGDLERTMDSSQNVFRAVWTQVKLLAIAFGEELRPEITAAAVALKEGIKASKEWIMVWTRAGLGIIKTAAKGFWKWREAIFSVTLALGGLFILAKIIGMVWAAGVAIAALVAATAGLKILLLGWALVVAEFVAGHTILVTLIAATAKLVLMYREWNKAIRATIGLEERLAAILERAAKRRKDIAMEEMVKGLREKWPEVKPWPTGMRDPMDVPEDQKRFERMKDALQFEFDYLGKIDDVRERALERSKVKEQTDQMANLTAAERNNKLTEYMNLLDRIHEKQRSFSHTVQLWINDSIEWGKNLGEILTASFDRASDALADFVLKGKADFASLANSIVSDMTRMIIKAEMAQAFGMLMPGMSGGTGAYGGRGLLGSIFPVGNEAVPSAQSGGTVERTGLAKIHKGETFSGVGNENREGNTVNINVSAMDDVGTYNFLDKNKRIIADMLQGTIDSNHSLRRSKGWRS